MPATLNADLRAKLGTRDSKLLRLRGRVPASLQGEGKQSLHLSLDEDQFLAARRAHEHLFHIVLGQGAPESALVRELAWDAFGERIVHVEFRRVVLDRETEAEVELEFVGHPKEGVLQHLVAHVTIRALPLDIPDHIEVNVDGLEEGKPMTAKDLLLPKGVKLAIPLETPICQATTKTTTEPTVAAAAEGAVVEGAAALAVPGAAAVPATAEKGDKGDKGEKPEKEGKPEKAAKPEKPERKS